MKQKFKQKFEYFQQSTSNRCKRQAKHLMLLGALLFINYMGAFAQTWTNVGPAAFSGGALSNLDLTFNGTIPYVAYSDNSTGNKLIVKKFDGASWPTVGLSGFTPSTITYPSLEFDGTTPYVAFQDGNTALLKASVMKFNGTTWVYVGLPGFSATAAKFESLVIHNGTPYVAFQQGITFGGATVMKFDGTSWVNVGNPVFTVGETGSISLAFNGNTPYVAFQDATTLKANVMKFDGMNWVYEGTPNFSATAIGFLKLAFNGTMPYVSFSDVSNKVSVMKFDGTSWVYEGASSFSPGMAFDVSFAINGTIPYVAFRDLMNSNKANVMKYDGTNWVFVGTPGFSSGATQMESLAFNGSIPYLAFKDNNNAQKLTVMSFGTPCVPTSSSFSQTITIGSSYTFNGVSLTIAGTYLDTLVNVGGCDSIITLNLSVSSTPPPAVVMFNCPNSTTPPSFIFTTATSNTNSYNVQLLPGNVNGGQLHLEMNGPNFHGSLDTLLPPNPTAAAFNIWVPYSYDGGGVAGIQTIGVSSPQAINSNSPMISDTCYILAQIAPIAPPASVTINQASTQIDPASSSPVLFTAVFGSAIDPATFTASDIILSGTATGATVTSVTEIVPNNGTTFEVAVAATGTGTIIASIPGFSNATIAVGNTPYDIVHDAFNNVYISKAFDNTILKITPAGVSSTFATTGAGPTAMVFDASGNLFVCNSNDNTISKITPSGASSVFATAGATPQDITIDNVGNLYTVDYGSQTVSKISPSGVVTTFVSGLVMPTSIVADASGNIFVSTNGTVKKYDASGLLIATYNVPRAADLCIDPSQNVYCFNGGYVGNINSNTMVKITSAGVVSTITLSTTVLAHGSSFGQLTSDANGNIYVTNSVMRVIFKVTPAGVVSILGVLPLPASSRHGITVTPSGNVYVSTSSTNSVSVISGTPSGNGILSLAGIQTQESTSTDNLITLAAASGATASVLSGGGAYCNPGTSTLSVAITGGISPYTLVYNDGTNNFTESNYTSGSSIVVSPTSTTTYSLVSVSDASLALGTGNSGSATVIVTPSSNNTTTASACDSYSWNGQTYTASGIYTGTTTNCVTELLDLTITPSSNNTTTASACDSYSWNGQTYTATGIYTGTTTNCVTELLDLTITPSSNNTTTASACDSYSWNGQTYTASGIYTGNTTNCVTELLNLTITPSSNNTTTASACDSYSWNGQTYTATGIYTGATSNCITQILNLTILPKPVVTVANAIKCPNVAVSLVGVPAGGSFSVANPYNGPATAFNYTFTAANGCATTTSANVNLINAAQFTLFATVTPGTTTAVAVWPKLTGTVTYFLWYRIKGSNSPWLTPTTQGTSLNLAMLTPNTLYECKMRIRNSACNTFSAFGPIKEFTTTNEACGTPTTLITPFATTANSALIKWNSLAGTGSYHLWYKRSTSSVWLTPEFNGSISQFMINNLLPNSTYQVRIRNRCANVFNYTPFSATTTFTTGASINNKSNDALISTTEFYSIFPNPTNGIVNIEFEAIEASNVLVKVYDMTGRLIKQVQTKSTEGLNNISLDLNDFAAGIYTLQVFENNKIIYTSKVSKQD